MRATRVDELYEEDFFAWTRSQARELRRFARSRPNLALDVEHIAEEIADLGSERRDSVRSWTARIIEHLLLLEHSPAQEPRRGWIDEIVNFRSEVERRLSRTLERDLKRRLPLLYGEAAICKESSSATARLRSQLVCPKSAPTTLIRCSATSGRLRHDAGPRSGRVAIRS